MFAAQQSDIAAWFDEGVAKGATHMIVAVDTWDHEDYPVFVMPGENARAVAESYSNKEGQRLMEVYNLSLDMDTQLGERRAHNF